MSAAAGSAEPKGDAPTRHFFGWLLAVSALPFAFLPLSAHAFPDARAFDLGTALLLLLGSQGHVAASFLFYAEPGARAFMLGERPVRFLVAPGALVVATAALLHFADRSLTSYLVVAFWIWQTHHYTRQNHGILAFASVAEGLRPTLAERTAVTLAGVAGVIGMIRFVTPYDATVLAPWGWHLHATAIGVFACAWISYLWSLREPAARESPLRIAVVLMLMLFYLPLFFYTDPLSAVFTYAVAHGLQYLVFMVRVAGTPPERRRLALAGLVALTLIGGALLRRTWHAGEVLGPWNPVVFGAGLGVVMWHFLLDAGIWRLSEPFQRAYMAERFPFLRARNSRQGGSS